MTRFLPWLKRRGPQSIFRAGEPSILKFNNQTWVRDEDVKIVRRAYFALLADHCGREFADYVFVLVNDSLEAYQRANPWMGPSPVKGSFSQKANAHPSVVRTTAELEGRRLPEVEAEIVANARRVLEACASVWAPHLRSAPKAQSEEVGS